MSQRRNQKLVDREVQSTLVFRLFFHWTLFILANVAAVVAWIRFIEMPTEDWAAVQSITIQRLIPLGLISIAIIPAFVLDTVKLSNRFSGPILRVRRMLARIANGEKVDAIEFRDNDFWQDLSNDLNRAFLQNKEANANEKK